MSEHSAIGWTDATWPLVAGCDYASPGCSNCWAVRDSWRLSHNPHAQVRRAYEGTVRKTEDGKLVWTGVVRPLPERLAWPLTWRKARRIFVCSQSDLFHPKVPFEFIAAVFGIGAMCPHHTLQMLTKHPGRALEFFRWLDQQQGGPLQTCLWHARKFIGDKLANQHDPFADDPPAWPLANVWIGCTVEDQKRADERIPLLWQIPAVLRWLSVEPMLERISISTQTVPARAVIEAHGRGMQEVPPEAVKLAEAGHDVHIYDLGGINWVVCGGESAQTRTNTRPFDIGWARSLRAECKRGNVSFFMKQLGTRPLPQLHDGMIMRNTLPLPDGKTSRYKWHEPQHWPIDLQVQEFPA